MQQHGPINSGFERELQVDLPLNALTQPVVRGLGAIAEKGFITGGEAMDPRQELLKKPVSNYLGRIDFGSGNIDAEDVTVEEFKNQLEVIRVNHLDFISDLRLVHGSCMDGRNDIKTESGNILVGARPKIIGGPSLFAWNVASIGGFSVLNDVDRPIDQFAEVNRLLVEAGVFLGMHRVCGAAMGAAPVTENYTDYFEQIHKHVGAEARALGELNGGKYLTEIREGAGQTNKKIVAAGNSFTEDKMIKVVLDLGGPEAVTHLEVDHEHETHGHEEDGLVFMRVRNAIISKERVNEETGRMLFYNNSLYARRIVEVLARTKEELIKGIIIADQLPIAGVATLGKGQHVGELTGHFLAA